MTETATFAAGCFWCTEAVFKEVRGVQSVVPGYAGGTSKHPSYEKIHRANSGHAESVQISFDSSVVPYETLVQIFFGTHDPTQLNRQGNDVGEEYRSVIFYHDEEQKEVAERVKGELESERVFGKPIVTAIEPFRGFYEAEPEHLDFYARNRKQPYCQAIIDPKMAKFRRRYQEYLK